MEFNGRSIILYFLKEINGICCLLDGNLCSIHSYKPYQCKNAPEHFLTRFRLWDHLPCVKEGVILPRESSEFDVAIAKEYFYFPYTL
jgi:hypothetical protein